MAMLRRASMTDRSESSGERKELVRIHGKNAKKEGMLSFISMPNMGETTSAVESTYQLPSRPWESKSMLTPDDHIIW
jgi:hypothetical protein